MNHQKITVVTVCYNAERDIEKTIQSVINQTYDNIEYIIVDGASKDGTMQVVEKYKDKIAKIVSEPDKGIYDAMNKGIKLATGEWINFMNAGDRFFDDKVIGNLFFEELEENIGVIFGDSYNNNGLCKMKPFIYTPDKLCPMGICHQSLFVRTSLAKENPFDPSFKVAADYNMVRTIYDKGFTFKEVHTPVAIYDMYGFSANNSILQIDETARICHKYGSFVHLWYRNVRKVKNMIKQLLHL